MRDLIGREDAIRAIVDTESKVARETPYDSEVFTVMAKRQHEILDVLLTLQSADAVEVVRCKDCRNLFAENGCPLRTWHTHVEDDFCSYGERRSE